jgi:hypothetical protein
MEFTYKLPTSDRLYLISKIVRTQNQLAGLHSPAISMTLESTTNVDFGLPTLVLGHRHNLASTYAASSQAAESSSRSCVTSKYLSLSDSQSCIFCVVITLL